MVSLVDPPDRGPSVPRIGLYFDLRNPAAWHRPWAAVYRRTLELISRAESLGVDAVWLTEHHFFDDGYLSQPITLAAAIAARTNRVRIGTAVLIAPLRPAIQIAEEAAIVDLVSDGRFELGLGAGYRRPEFSAFGADPDARFVETDARAVQVRRLFEEGGISPGPVQERLPIWLGYTSVAGARRAGRMGEGLLTIAPELLEPYRHGLREGGHDPAIGRMAGMVNVILADDPEAAWVRIKPHLAYQALSYQRYSVEGTDRPPPPPVDPEELRKGKATRFMRPFDVVTVDECAALVRRTVAGVPATDVFFWSSIAGMDDDLVDRHVELVGQLRSILAAN